MIYIIIGIVLSIILLGLRIVPPNTAWIITRLGKPVRYAESGLNLLIPWIELMDLRSLATKNISLNTSWITSDSVICEVSTNIVYRVISWYETVKNSLYTIQDFRGVLRAAVEEQIRAKVVEFNHQEIFKKKSEVWDTVKNELVNLLSQYGYEIESVQVQDIKLDEKVTIAMNWVVAAKREKEAMITIAEGEAEVKRLEWVWMAQQRQEIANWFKESVDEFKKIDDTLNWKEVLEKLIEMSRIDMAEKVWTSDNAKIVFMDSLDNSSKQAVLTGEMIKK